MNATKLIFQLQDEVKLELSEESPNYDYIIGIEFAINKILQSLIKKPKGN